MISVNNLTFDYPNTRALDNVSFKIEPNTITALVGPNGAGKTTLLRCLAALDSWTMGELFIDEIKVEDEPRKIHKLCGYLSDFFGLYDDLTVSKALQFIALSRGATSSTYEELCIKAAKLLNLMDFYDKEISSLSRGQRQRVAIAQTIVVPPKVLILDEPASGLDPQARFELSQLLLDFKKQGMTIIVSSHILYELEDYSTHMLMIKNGKITQHCTLNQMTQDNPVYKIVLEHPISESQAQLIELGINIIEAIQNTALVTLDNEINPKTVLQLLVKHHIPVENFSVEKKSMQQIYLSLQHKDGEL